MQDCMQHVCARRQGVKCSVCAHAGKGWQYSAAAVTLITEFHQKFPWVAALCQLTDSPTLLVADAFPDLDAEAHAAKVAAVLAWRAKSALARKKLVPCTSSMASPKAVQDLDQTLAAVSCAPAKQWEVADVKAELLLPPIGAGTTAAVTAASVALGDFVAYVGAADGANPPFGTVGVAIAVHDRFADVLCAEKFATGGDLEGRVRKGYGTRLPFDVLMNLTTLSGADLSPMAAKAASAVAPRPQDAAGPPAPGIPDGTRGFHQVAGLGRGRKVAGGGAAPQSPAGVPVATLHPALAAEASAGAAAPAAVPDFMMKLLAPPPAPAPMPSAPAGPAPPSAAAPDFMMNLLAAPSAAAAAPPPAAPPPLGAHDLVMQLLRPTPPPAAAAASPAAPLAAPPVAPPAVPPAAVPVPSAPCPPAAPAAVPAVPAAVPAAAPAAPPGMRASPPSASSAPPVPAVRSLRFPSDAEFGALNASAQAQASRTSLQLLLEAAQDVLRSRGSPVDAAAADLLTQVRPSPMHAALLRVLSRYQAAYRGECSAAQLLNTLPDALPCIAVRTMAVAMCAELGAWAHCRVCVCVADCRVVYAGPACASGSRNGAASCSAGSVAVDPVRGHALLLAGAEHRSSGPALHERVDSTRQQHERVENTHQQLRSGRRDCAGAVEEQTAAPGIADPRAVGMSCSCIKCVRGPRGSLEGL